MKFNFFTWLGICLSLSGAAKAECKNRLLGDTAPAYVRLLEARMHEAGVSGEYFSTDGKHYMNFAYRPMVSLNQTDTIVEEIRTGLSEPYSTAEFNHMITTAAFTVSHYSEIKEIDAREQIYSSIERNKDQKTWVEHFGDMIAVITRSSEGIVIVMSKYICS